MATYNTVKAFINDMLDNEGVIFSDRYRRKWMYENYQFIHRDLSDTTWQNGLFCLHLHSTEINKET